MFLSGLLTAAVQLGSLQGGQMANGAGSQIQDADDDDESAILAASALRSLPMEGVFNGRKAQLKGGFIKGNWTAEVSIPWLNSLNPHAIRAHAAGQVAVYKMCLPWYQGVLL